MTKPDELYRLYKTSRTRVEDADERVRTGRENAVAPDASLDEIEQLYKAYRRDRDPDFEQSIAAVMQVAKEKVFAENTVRQIADQLAESPARQLSSKAVTSELADDKNASDGWAARLLNVPGRVIDSVVESVSSLGAPKWLSAGIPVLAMVVVIGGLLGYGLRDSNHLAGDLDVLSLGNSKQANLILDQYVDASSSEALAFAGSMSDNSKTFFLGVELVTLQLASNAKNQPLVEQSVVRMSGLLTQESDKELLAQLNSLSTDYASMDSKAIAESIITSTHATVDWFAWGRAVQQVHVVAQFVLNGENTPPIDGLIKNLEATYVQLDNKQISAAESNAMKTIASFSGQQDLSSDDLRTIRDSARDLKALRKQSGL